MADRPVSALLVEDDEDDYVLARELFARVATPRVSLEWSATYEASLAAMLEQRHDLYLLDYRLGAHDGVELLREASRRGFGSAPVLLLTGHDDPSIDALAASAGASDYLVKGQLTPPLLGRAVRYALARHHATCALRRSDAEKAVLLEEIHHRVKQLEERERWLSTTLRSIGDAVVATDGNDRVAFLNAVAERLTGWSNADAVGRAIGEVLALTDATTHAPISPPTARALVGQGIASLSKCELAPHGGGAPVIVDDSAAAIVTDEGSLLGGVLVFRDVTERCAMERRLASSERLAAVGTMPAGVAHEINNPLTYVTMNIDFTLATLDAYHDRAETGRVREALEEAREGAERVRKIVGSLRRFAHVDDTGRVPMDPTSALESALRMTAHVLRHKARLVRAYDAAPMVLANENQLVQVFTNLLANAIDAIPEGDPAAHEVRVATSTDGAGRAVVEVRDTGSGIRPEHVGRVFEPFFTTKGVGEGTGLGLSISHGIVAALGGEISVESEVGVGSAFRVCLPPSPPAAPVAPTPTSTAAPTRARILVVDDEQAVARAIARMLSTEHVVAAETDPRAALARILAEPFDVVLCDVMMPAMDGVELYERVASSDDARARRFVFMTGGAFTARARAFLAGSTCESIAKPFTGDTLRAVVRERVRAVASSAAETAAETPEHRGVTKPRDPVQ